MILITENWMDMDKKFTTSAPWFSRVAECCLISECSAVLDWKEKWFCESLHQILNESPIYQLDIAFGKCLLFHDF